MKRVAQGIFVLIFTGTVFYLFWLWGHLLFARTLVAIGIAVAIGASILFVRARDRGERRRAMRHMEGRPSLTTEEFGRSYFAPGQADVAAQVRAIFARHIDVDVSQSHPDDRIVEDLRMDSLDSMSTVEFVFELEKNFKIAILDGTAKQMRTLRDITEFVCRELRARACA